MANFYKNQEVYVTAKFLGVADDGKIQLKLRGIDSVMLEVDEQYVSASAGGSSNGVAPRQSITETVESHKRKKRNSSIKKKDKRKKSDMDLAADEAWGDSDGEAEEKQKSKAPKQATIVEADDEVDADIEEEPVPKKKKTAVASSGEERFHAKQHFKSMVVEENGNVLRTTESKSVMCGFGTTECDQVVSTYHWKIEVVEGNDVNLGVIFNDACKKNKKEMWWLADEGYSYWGDDGQIYHSDKYKKYGEKYGAGDVIDIWLNLKKFNISFAKNDERYGKAFKVDKEQTYRLAVGVSGHPHTLKLIAFDVSAK